MSARLLLEIALRVMGVWFFLIAIGNLPMTVALFFSRTLATTDYVVGYSAMFCMQLLLGAVLIFWAPAMAARFYPPASESAEPRVAIGPGDIYRTACFVLGVYLLVQTAGPAGRLAIVGARGSWWGDEMTVDAINAFVYGTSGLLLIFGSRWIAQCFTNLGYDPDTIPKQHFSIAMLLILVVLVGVLLIVIQQFVK